MLNSSLLLIQISDPNIQIKFELRDVMEQIFNCIL